MRRHGPHVRLHVPDRAQGGRTHAMISDDEVSTRARAPGQGRGALRRPGLLPECHQGYEALFAAAPVASATWPPPTGPSAFPAAAARSWARCRARSWPGRLRGLQPHGGDPAGGTGLGPHRRARCATRGPTAPWASSGASWAPARMAWPGPTSCWRRPAEPSGPRGKPLYGGQASLGLPGEPLADAWRRADMLREYWGDAHIAAWTTAGLDATEIGLLHGALSACRCAPTSAGLVGRRPRRRRGPPRRPGPGGRGRAHGSGPGRARGGRGRHGPPVPPDRRGAG